MNLHLAEREEQLVKDCLKDKPRAQRELYNLYAPKMLGVCLRYIGEEVEAEDVLMQGFIKVFKNLTKFRFEGSLEGWIRRIMINESLTYIRRNKTIHLEIETVENIYSDELSIRTDHLELEDLVSFVSRLPAGYRTVFNLYAIEGFSHREIAEKLGINENTSKSQLSRARNMLQRFIKMSETELKKQKDQ